MTGPFDGTEPTSVDLRPEIVLAGRFTLVQRLGTGGIGEVWLAQDRALDNRAVALKMLKPVLAGDGGAVADLKREVVLTRDLSHTHIVRMYDLHQHGAVCFISMEYVAGHSLAAALAHRGRQPFPLGQVLGWAQQLAQALDYAHKQGVLHRDVKPGNMLTASDGSVKLADFGIARVAKDIETRWTGQIASGTLAYMSPQQLMNDKAHRNDPRNDVYSLAAALYELLAGEPPFSGGDISAQILTKTPDPIDGVPDYVNTGLLRGLAKEIAERPDTASDLVAALSRPQTAPPKPAAAAPPSVRTRKRGWLIAALIVLAVVLGAALGAAYFVRRQVVPPAPAPAVTAEDANAGMVSAKKAREDAVKAEAEQYAAADLAAAEDLWTVANAHFTLRHYDEAAGAFREAEGAYRQASGKTLQAKKAAGERDQVLKNLQDEVSAARAKAEEVQAPRLAKDAYDKAQAAELAAASVKDHAETVRKLGETKLLYERVAEDAKQKGPPLLETAKKNAEAAATRAQTPQVKKFAAKTLSEADDLLKQAGSSTAGPLAAASLYDDAAKKFDKAIEAAREAEAEIRKRLAQAITLARAARDKIGEAERSKAIADVMEGDRAFGQAALAANDNPEEAILLYKKAQDSHEVAYQMTHPPTPGAGLRVDPARLRIALGEAPQRITIYRGAAPLATEELQGMVGHDIFDVAAVDNAPGTFTISTIPDKAKVGTYTLTVASGDEKCRIEVEVVAELAAAVPVPPVASPEAPATVAASDAPAETVSDGPRTLPLPPQYVEGQFLRYPTEGDPSRYYIWTLNGKVVLEGVGKTELVYPLDTLGTNTLELVQKSDDTVIMRGTAKTSVVAEPTQTWSTTVGMDLSIPAAPEQYSKYEWRIGGKTVSTESVLRFTFDTPGTHSVECRMTDPIQKAERAFRRVVWNVEVK